jgi:hypothetical protein
MVGAETDRKYEVNLIDIQYAFQLTIFAIIAYFVTEIPDCTPLIINVHYHRIGC